jgi:DnaK suppressor protein
MKPQDLEKCRALLLASRESLLSEAINAVSSSTQQEERYADPCDRASYDHDQAFFFRIRDRESRLLRKIEQALARLDRGEYGSCEECGEEIALGRLLARPVAMLCIDCKRRMEELEKTYWHE